MADESKPSTEPPFDPRGCRAVVIVPAYNEAKAIGRTLRDLRRHAGWAQVVVVNDGSSDDTAEVARAAGAKVLDLPVNLGIGGAVQTGYRWALKYGFDVAVQFDGDGQHRARRMSDVIRPLVEGKADLVIGSRFLLPRGMTAYGLRLVGIGFLARVVSWAAGQKVTDPTSGFRAAGRRAIKLFATEYPQDYPEPESLVLARRQGLMVSEVPVAMRRRRRGASSISAVAGIHYMSKVTLAILMDMVKAPVRLKGEVAQ